MGLARIKKNSIAILLSSVAVLIFINVSITFYYRHTLSDNLLLKNETDRFKSYTNSVLSDIVHGADLSVRGYGLTKNDGFTQPLREVFKNKDSIFTSMESILKRQGHGLREFNEMKEATERYLKFSQYMLAFAEKDSMDIFLKLLNEDRGYVWWKKFEPFRTSLFQFEDELNETAQNKYETALTYNTITQTLLFILGIPTIFLVIFKLKEEVKNGKKLLAKLDQSNRNYVFDTGTSSEIEDSAEIVESLIINLRNAAEFVRHISKGSMNAQWNGLHPGNEALNKENLAGALVNMRNQMVKFSEEERIRSWVTEGVAHFGMLLRANDGNIKKLYSEIISQLVKYMKANQAGLFILNKEGREPFFDLVACYAYDRKKYLDKKVGIKEGLIGQAFQEKGIIYLTDIPKDYISITSGLGEATPRSLLIVPLQFNETIVGVLEMASLKTFLTHEIEFLKKIADGMAATISGIQINEKTTQLLEASQQQTEELKAAEEEMRQNMEELAATQEEVLRSKAITETLLEEQKQQLKILAENGNELQRMNENMEQVRLVERKRAATQIDSQKSMMSKIIERHKKAEQDYKNRIMELENKVAVT